MLRSRAHILVLVGAVLGTTACSPPRAPAPSGTSPMAITERSWTDERGDAVHLATWRGTPLVVTMIYRTCRFRCPMTLAKLRLVETTFRNAGQPVEFVLATLDPHNDTPARLATFKRNEHLDDASWHLLSGDDDTTKELARFLRVHAFKDDTHIDHDVKIAVFDSAGRFTRSFEGWDFAPEDVVAATRR